MKEYKYYLDKSSKKFNCPQCGKKRFVKYIESETGEYADCQYGRCDREISCGYLRYPKSGNSIANYNFVKPVEKEPSYIDEKIFNKSLNNYDFNQLILYLLSKYDEGEVLNVICKYHIGTSNMYNGGTVFWQIDNTGNIRTGKIMAYNTNTGKRVKKDDGKALINWVHSALKLSDYNLKQCLFGLHLLSKTKKQVAIVESEKTAIIMSLEFQDYTWMATGSFKGFKYEYLSPLKNYEIIAFPDKGCYDEWTKVADDLNDVGFNIRVSSLLENNEFSEGWDLEDILKIEPVNNTELEN